MTLRTIQFLLLGFLTVQAAAQDRFADVKIESERIADGIFMLTGQGGNIGVVVGDGATFIIDDQFAPLAERIQAAIAKLSDNPVGFVVNTHWHGDHIGGNEHFGNAGSVIVAHDNVRNRMSVESFNSFSNTNRPPAPPAARPVVTFADDITLHLNGKTIQVRHIASAHTDGDAAVFFVEDNVLHAGDLVFHRRYPFIDINSGGSIDGFIAASTELIGWIDADTKIIPGHGPLANRDDLRAIRDFLTTTRDAIVAMIADGKTLEQVVAAKPTARYDATMNPLGGEPDRWVAALYKALSAR